LDAENDAEDSIRAEVKWGNGLEAGDVPGLYVGVSEG